MSIYDNLQNTDDPVQKDPQVQPDRRPQRSSKSKKLADTKPSDTSREGNRQLTVVLIVICTSTLENIYAGQLFNAIEEFIGELRCFAKKNKINVLIDTLINEGAVYWRTNPAVPLDNYEWGYPNHGGKFSSSKVFDALKRRLKNYGNDEYAPILYFFGGKIEANVNSSKYQSLQDHAIFQRAVRNSVPINPDCITEFYNAFATSPNHVLTELTPECLKKGLVLKPMKEQSLQCDEPSALKALTEAEQKIKNIETLFEDSKKQYSILYQKYQAISTDLQLVQNKYNQTLADYNSANNKNSEYQKKIKTIKSENKKLKDDIKQAQEANIILENAYNSIFERLQSSLKNNLSWQEAYNILQSENSTLQSENKSLEMEKYRSVCAERVEWMNKCDAVCAERDRWIKQYNSKSTELAELKSASVKQLSKDDIINFAKKRMIKSYNARSMGMYSSDANQFDINEVTRIAIEDMIYSYQKLLSESKGLLELDRFPELEKSTQSALEKLIKKTETIRNNVYDDTARIATEELIRVERNALARFNNNTPNNNDPETRELKATKSFANILLTILNMAIISLVYLVFNNYYIDIGGYHTQSKFAPLIILLISIGLYGFTSYNYYEHIDKNNDGCLVEVLRIFIILMIFGTIVIISHAVAS